MSTYEDALREILSVINATTTESDDHDAMRVVREITRKALGLPPGTDPRIRRVTRPDLFDADGYYIGWRDADGRYLVDQP